MAVPKPTEKIYGTEEAVAKSLLELIKSKKFKILSDLDDEEILNLSLLLTWGERIKCKAIVDFCENFLQLRISRYRLGRREIVNVASYAGSSDRKKARSIRDLFAGLR